MKMISFSEKICRWGLMCVLFFAVALLNGCAWFQEEFTNVRASLLEEPENVAPPTNTAPTLAALSASPNPVGAGKSVVLTAKYEDREADLQQGLGAISIDGAEPLAISFRAIYPSGLLTFSVPISSYARASSLKMALKVRDDAGNWSNLVSTVVTVE